jgi:transmembrane sensor
MSSLKSIEESASVWLARRDSGKWSDADQAGLSDWLRASTAHRVAYLRLEAAWAEAGRLKALGAGLPLDHVPPLGALGNNPFFKSAESGIALPSGAPKKTPRRWPYALAASVLLCVVGAIAWRFYTPHNATYETIVGGLEAVPLADGSHMTLNSDSEVQVAVTAKERGVELNHGEAFFEVAKDPTRPFIVRAGHARVIAVGTQFSVRREGDQVDVVVIEGHVRVERDNQPAGAPPALLAPGDVARSDGQGVLVQEKPLPEAEAILSWRSGFLVFHDTPLKEAVTQFNRYNTRKIIIDDPKVGSLKIGGNFKSTNSEAFVRLIESGLPIRAEHRDGQIILRGE